MSIQRYDDGDGRVDVRIECDACSVHTWDEIDAKDDGWMVRSDDGDQTDLCPTCGLSEKKSAS